MFSFMKRYGFLFYAVAMSLTVTVLVADQVRKTPSFRFALYQKAIVEVFPAAANGSGTGFRFWHNGKTYIATASHVCMSIGQQKTLLRHADRTVETKQLALSVNHDVCVLEDNLGGPALYLDTSTPKFAQDVFTIGYSGSTGLTYGEGQVTQRMPGSLPLPVTDEGFFECSATGGMPTINAMGVYCDRPTSFLASNVTIFRGQSGSPLLNSSGQVVGVASQMVHNGSFWSESRHLVKLMEGLK